MSERTIRLIDKATRRLENVHDRIPHKLHIVRKVLFLIVAMEAKIITKLEESL